MNYNLLLCLFWEAPVGFSDKFQFDQVLTDRHQSWKLLKTKSSRYQCSAVHRAGLQSASHMEGSTLCKCTSVYSQIYCSALQPQGSAARNMIGYLRKVVKQNAQTGNCLQPLTCIILVQLSGRKFQPPQKLSETFPIWLESGILHQHSCLLTLLKRYACIMIKMTTATMKIPSTCCGQCERDKNSPLKIRNTTQNVELK